MKIMRSALTNYPTLISVRYKLIHETGSGKYDGGKYSGAYLFTIIGENGKTGSHDCPADRNKGVTASCTIEDAAKIGKLVGMRINNTSSDAWRFVKMFVESSEGRVGRLDGEERIGDKTWKVVGFSISYCEQFTVSFHQSIIYVILVKKSAT